MDNFHIDITSEGEAHLRAALDIAFRGQRHAIGYYVKDGTLIFCWAEHKEAIKLPFKMDSKRATDFTVAWLSEVDYGKQPDHDGDNGKGWRVFNEAWGHVGGYWQAFVAIQPQWAMYGK
jgi:hypothetical protein